MAMFTPSLAWPFASGTLRNPARGGSGLGQGALPGEQQRIAFARVLLTRPKAAFLDEATSALDEGQEYALYRLLREELPDCIVVSMSHRSTVERHHDRQLELLGGGAWRLSRTAS
jgi:ABC-type uncharacterized transport system fused permease/ATPase subunit